jgi:hypothetical protein
MTCEQAQSELSAHLDGQASEAAAVETHLDSCAPCRAVFESLRSDAASLRAAISDLRSAARAAADDFAGRYRVPRARRRIRFGAAVAAAAGLLVGIASTWALSGGSPVELAALSRRVAELETTRRESDERYAALAARFEEVRLGGLGRLTHLIGGMEAREPGTTEWSPAYIGMVIASGAAVRTASGATAAVRLRDGSELRLNEGTEISFDGAREARLGAGEMWAQVRPDPAQFKIHTRDGRVEVLGTEIGVKVTPSNTLLMVFSGTARIVNDARREREVKAGEAALADRERIAATSVAHMERATRWMLDLLIARGRDHPELDRQIARLFEMMGQSKVAYLTEEEIKSYGSACTIPIARYLESPACRGDLAQRRKAARILADIGDWYAVDAFLSLLEDEDAEVRAHAARGLRRVTGQDFGWGESFWSASPVADRARASERWGQWWSTARSSRVTDDLEKQLERVKKKTER